MCLAVRPKRLVFLSVAGLLLGGCAQSSWQSSAYESLRTVDSDRHPVIGTPSPNPPANMNYPAYDSQRQQLLQGTTPSP